MFCWIRPISRSHSSVGGGLRVLAVDGSTGRLPDFLAIEEYFGKPSGSGVPLARFSRLFDVLNDQILHADMVPYATGERELAAEYLLYSSPDDLFLYDRGYPAFWLFAFHAQEQRHYFYFVTLCLACAELCGYH